MIIDIILPKDYWKYPTQINMQIYDKRIIILKRYMEEIFQYFMSQDYGIGKLFTYFPALVKVDKNNNPPPPLLWNCIIKNSLIELPRNSSNVDIIGMQMHNENDNNNSSSSSNI